MSLVECTCRGTNKNCIHCMGYGLRRSATKPSCLAVLRPSRAASKKKKVTRSQRASSKDNVSVVKGNEPSRPAAVSRTPVAAPPASATAGRRPAVKRACTICGARKANVEAHVAVKHRPPIAAPNSAQDAPLLSKAEGAPAVGAGGRITREVSAPPATMQTCPLCGAQRKSVADHIRAKHPAADPDFVRRHPGRVIDIPNDLKPAKHVKALAVARTDPRKAGEAPRDGKPADGAMTTEASRNRPGHRKSQAGAEEDASAPPPSAGSRLSSRWRQRLACLKGLGCPMGLIPDARSIRRRVGPRVTILHPMFVGRRSACQTVLRCA